MQLLARRSAQIQVACLRSSKSAFQLEKAVPPVRPQQLFRPVAIRIVIWLVDHRYPCGSAFPNLALPFPALAILDPCPLTFFAYYLNLFWLASVRRSHHHLWGDVP